MSSITIALPDELATQLQARTEQLPEILQMGIREHDARGQLGYEGAADILDVLASLPAPETVLALRPSPALQARISHLLEMNRNQGLTPQEEQEWSQYEQLEHLVRMAKLRAFEKQHGAKPSLTVSLI